MLLTHDVSRTWNAIPSTNPQFSFHFLNFILISSGNLLSLKTSNSRWSLQSPVKKIKVRSNGQYCKIGEITFWSSWNIRLRSCCLTCLCLFSWRPETADWRLFYVKQLRHSIECFCSLNEPFLLFCCNKLSCCNKLKTNCYNRNHVDNIFLHSLRYS